MIKITKTIYDCIKDVTKTMNNNDVCEIRKNSEGKIRYTIYSKTKDSTAVFTETEDGYWNKGDKQCK